MKKKTLIGVIVIGCLTLVVGFYLWAKKDTELNDKVATGTKKVEVSSSDVTETLASTSSGSTVESLASNEVLTNERDLPKELLPYSDEEIEYARVWLAVMGEDYFDKIGEYDFNLNVNFIPKGTLVSEYGNYNNTSWPTDVITLSGDVSAQGKVVYGSNYDGTVTVYPYAPSRWHYSEEQFKDEAFMKQVYEDIINTTETVSIPAGNPELVKQVIEMEMLSW